MNTVYRSAKYIISVMNMAQLPENSLSEVVFAGCSNAGKSSVINTLTDQHKLARVSKTPGRTQSLNFFQITDSRYIVDLPGYGYSKVSTKTRSKWEALMETYFQERKELKGFVIVMDVRHPLKQYDQNMLAWSEQNNISSHIVLTKSDKLKRGPAKETVFKVSAWIEEQGFSTTVQLFSSLKRDGVKELHEVLDKWLGL